MIYKTLHRKLKIEQHKPHKKAGVNSRALEGYIVGVSISCYLSSVIHYLLSL